MNEVGIEKGIRSGSKNVGIKLELKECEKEEKIISFIVSKSKKSLSQQSNKSVK